MSYDRPTEHSFDDIIVWDCGTIATRREMELGEVTGEGLRYMLLTATEAALMTDEEIRKAAIDFTTVPY